MRLVTTGLAVVAVTLPTAFADGADGSGSQAQKSPETTDDAFAYSLVVPQAVTEYNPATQECIQANEYVANSGLRFRGLEVIPASDRPASGKPASDKPVSDKPVSDKQYEIIQFDPIKEDPEDARLLRCNSNPDCPGSGHTSYLSLTSAQNGKYFCLAKTTFDNLIVMNQLPRYYYAGLRTRCTGSASSCRSSCGGRSNITIRSSIRA